jgi:hypothetical protein
LSKNRGSGHLDAEPNGGKKGENRLWLAFPNTLAVLVLPAVIVLTLIVLAIAYALGWRVA